MVVNFQTGKAALFPGLGDKIAQAAFPFFLRRAGFHTIPHKLSKLAREPTASFAAKQSAVPIAMSHFSPGSEQINSWNRQIRAKGNAVTSEKTDSFMDSLLEISVKNSSSNRSITRAASYRQKPRREV